MFGSEDDGGGRKISFCACPTEVIVDPIVAGKWSVSAVNEIRSITTPAY
jgi:hypothetical protein